MLVVICAIRKFMECIFSRRELKVLDDLLPESNKKNRRHGGSIFNKKFSKREEDWQREEEEEEEKKRKKEAEETLALINRTKAMTLEFDDYGKVLT